MTQPPDPRRERRDALLDELKTSVEDWYAIEKKRTDDEVAFLKSVLRGRTGSDRLQRSTTTQGTVLALDDITSFLGGTS